jgi:hypothetical protein
VPPAQRRASKSEPELTQPEIPPEPSPRRYRVMVSIDGWTAGEVHELEPKVRTLALVALGYLREVEDGGRQGPA